MSDVIELLDITQAAAFLHVSETSLRRWTNAGRLPCFRVGGRRERRFRRADLLAFLERPTDAAPLGAHLCGLYTSDRARASQAAVFLADGLHAGSVCFLVATPNVRRRVVAQLGKARPELKRDIVAGRLVQAEYADAASGQLEFWHERLTAATGAGAHSLCVVGDVSGGRLARRRRFPEVLAYEADYDRLVARRFPVVTLCQYDARDLSGLEASQVLRCHGDALRYPVERLVG